MNENEITYVTSSDLDTKELSGFYQRLHHSTTKDQAKLGRMLAESFCFVTARLDGEIIGMARGITDGVRGYLAECKLDPRFQGPACITRTDGRIEHDSDGVAAALARRVIEALRDYGVERIHTIAYGTEVDFCEELGFKRVSGMVALQLEAGAELTASDGASACEKGTV